MRKLFLRPPPIGNTRHALSGVGSVRSISGTGHDSGPWRLSQFPPRILSFNASLKQSASACMPGLVRQPLVTRRRQSTLVETTTTPPTPTATLRKTLTEQQQQLAAQELVVLRDLRAALADINASRDDLELIDSSVRQLEDLFLLVIVGEFNAGKSTFLNALLGKRYLKEGVTPTTSKIGILRYGPRHESTAVGADQEAIAVPVEWLKEITLVDTPGTNAVIRSHQAITEHFVPRSDLVLFVTSVDRAFSESERTFLSLIKQWRKKVVVIVSKADILETPAQLDEVVSYVRRNFKELLGDEPEVFTVSARAALQAKVAALDPDALQASPQWRSSNFGAMENYILNTLTRQERLRLKLSNPVGIGEHLLAKYSDGIATRVKLLQGDLVSLQTIESQIAEFKRSTAQDFAYRNQVIDNVLLEMARRGNEFLDEHLSISGMLNLFRTEKLRGEFERAVIGDTSRDIERHVNDLIDWLLTKHERLWRDITEYVARRASVKSDDIMGKINVTFDYNRGNLLKSIGASASEVVASYDRAKEAQKLTDELQQTLVSTAAVEVGALGIGTLLAVSVMDVTGLLGVGALAATGLAIVPYKRTQMKAALTERTGQLRTRLKETLTRHFEHEQAQSLAKIDTAVEPYLRFVKAERDKLERTDSDFKRLSQQLAALSDSIARAF